MAKIIIVCWQTFLIYFVNAKNAERKKKEKNFQQSFLDKKYNFVLREKM